MPRLTREGREEEQDIWPTGRCGLLWGCGRVPLGLAGRNVTYEPAYEAEMRRLRLALREGVRTNKALGG